VVFWLFTGTKLFAAFTRPQHESSGGPAVLKANSFSGPEIDPEIGPAT
jgi:hypothetical protein